MKVLMAHSYHVQRGGADTSFEQESALLEDSGVEVVRYTKCNRDAVAGGWSALIPALARSAFNRDVYEETLRLCRTHRPDVAHVQNFWFSHSPSVHAACHAEGVATVQSLRDFRLICIGMYLLRDGRICEDCVGRGLTAGVRHRCYRNSVIQSAIAARMVHYNRRRGTWAGDVDLFVALTAHGKRTFVRGGIPADRIAVKANVVPDPGISGVEGKGAVFVGRLSPEKGLDTLLESWASLRDVPLGIVGEGPLRADIERAAGERDLANVRFEGALPFHESLERVRKAALLVMPSEWYETFGRVIVEAYAVGRPVVASRLGAMEELVDHGRTGLLFEPGNARDLAEKVRWLLERPERCVEMGRAARREYEERYRPDLAFRELMDVYERAIRHHTERSGTLSR